MDFDHELVPRDQLFGGGKYSTWEAEVKALRAEVKRLEKALRSIANNTCCDGCGEAARVARAAIGYPTDRVDAGSDDG